MVFIKDKSRKIGEYSVLWGKEARWVCTSNRFSDDKRWKLAVFEWKSEKPAGISGRSLSSQIPIDFKVHEASHRQGKSRWPTSPDTQTAHDLR